MAVGLLMTLKPRTYWEIGHMTKPDAEPPTELYIKIIRIFGVIVILAGVLLAGISLWPQLSGKEVKVSKGENWEVAFTESEQLAELKTLEAGNAAVPYEAVSDGQNIYFLGMADAPGLYCIPSGGDFAGAQENDETVLLAELDGSAGTYEALQYEDGILFWLQHSEDETWTVVNKLNLNEADPQAERVCTLTQKVEQYAYHDGNLYLNGGSGKNVTLWKWDGEESSKLVKKTVQSSHPLTVEEGWIAVVTDGRETVTRINLNDGSKMELEVSSKPDGVWTNSEYTLMLGTGGQSAAVRMEGRSAKQYVLKELGETGLAQLDGNKVWELDGQVLTLFDMEGLQYQEFEISAGAVNAMNISPDGGAVFCGALIVGCG